MPNRDDGHQQRSLRTLRLQIRYEGPDLSVDSIRSERMVTPPSEDAELDPEGNCGFWIELRDPEGHLLYVRVLQSPLVVAEEVFDPDGSIRREPVESVRGEFELLVPDQPDGATLHVYSSPPTLTGMQDAAVEIARFDLADEQRRLEGGE